MMKAILSASLLSAGLLSGSVLAQSAPDWTSQADALLAAHWSDTDPGVSVIITQNGEVLYARAAGFANLDAGVPATPNTVFRLGSITKQFAAAVALQLVEDGALSLDDTVGDFLPDYPEPGANATVRQLLNHTSGIQSYTGIPGWMVEANTNRAYTTAELIAEFADQPPTFQPGEAWAYNNSGYVLLGAVIEAVTGQAWHETVRERISEPLGLESVQYGEAEAAAAGMARGYTRNTDGEIAPAQLIHMSVPHAAGALIGDAADLADWAEALHAGDVVSSELYTEMTAPTVLPDGSEIDYGYGLVPGDVRGRDAIGHGGGIFGFVTDSVYLPQSDIFVAVLNNSDQPPLSPSLVTRRMASFALGDPYPVFTETALDLESVEPLFGLYTLENGDGARAFYARDGQLYTQRTGSSESQVWPAGEDRFFYGQDSLTWFEVVRAEDGSHVMNMHQQGANEAERALRTGPVPDQPEAIDLPEDVLMRYVGAYSLGGGVLTISPNGEAGLQAQLTGQPALEILPISDTEFVLVGVDARLVFDADGDAASAVTLFQGGQEIRAERLSQ